MAEDQNQNWKAELPPLPATPEAVALRRLFKFIIGNLLILIAGLAAGVVLGLLAQNYMPVTYEADGSFLVDEVPFSQNSISLPGAGSVSGAGLDALTQGDLVQSLILGIPSLEMRNAIAKRVGVNASRICFEDISPRPLSLRQHDTVANIRVSSVHNSRTATITVTSQSAQFAARVVNALLAELNNYNLVQGRLNSLKLDSSFASQRVDSIRLQLVQLEQTRGLQEQQVAELDKYQQDGLPLSSFPTFATDTTLNNLKTQLLLAQSDYASLSPNSSSEFVLESKKAEVTSIQNEIERHSALLADGLRSQLTGTKAQEDSLQAELQATQQKIRRYDEQRANWLQTFGDLAAMKKLLAADNPGSIAPGSMIVVTDRTIVPEKPKSPKLSLNLAVGLFLGGLIGLVVALARTLLDDRLVSPKIVPALTQLPCVASTRGLASGQNLLGGKPLNPAGFDPLRTRLLVDAAHGKKHIVGFTPCHKCGKSSAFVAHLAAMLAQAGHRTLIVDLHLDKSPQAALLGVKVKRGLGAWLAGNDPIDDYLTTTSLDKLALLACAPGEPAAQTLARRPLIKVLPQLQNSWDFILVDSPFIVTSWDLALALPAGSLVVITAVRGWTRGPRVVQIRQHAESQQWKAVGVALQRCW